MTHPIKWPAFPLAGQPGSMVPVAAREASSPGRKAKRCFDIAAAASALIILLPLLLTLALSIWLLLGRPILYSHPRLGKDGKKFRCLKFRTMVKDGDAVLRNYFLSNPEGRIEWETTRKLRQDPRVTPLGRILRLTSADELPQLLNVIRGDMSLVGPRPITEDEMSHYGAVIQDYVRTRPGLTGLWQVSGRNDLSYETRVALDQHYLLNWSFWLDLQIIFRTIPAVLRSTGTY